MLLRLRQTLNMPLLLTNITRKLRPVRNRLPIQPVRALRTLIKLIILVHLQHLAVPNSAPLHRVGCFLCQHRMLLLV